MSAPGKRTPTSAMEVIADGRVPAILAELRGLDIAEADRLTSANTMRLFGL